MWHEGGTLKMNHTANWNMLDSIIFSLEGKLGQVKAAVKDSKDEDPNVELLIRAETKHLRAENESLKKREHPLYLIEENGQIICPKCKVRQMDSDIKYCFNCGHRVIRRTTNRFINYDEDEIAVDENP